MRVINKPKAILDKNDPKKIYCIADERTIMFVGSKTECKDLWKRTKDGAAAKGIKLKVGILSRVMKELLIESYSRGVDTASMAYIWPD